MEEKIEEFKQFHKIETEIDLPFKIENDRLFTFYNDRWVQLSQGRNSSKYYCFDSLKHKYSVALCREIGIKIPGYSQENYLKYRESYRKASKKYYQKMCQDPIRYEK